MRTLFLALWLLAAPLVTATDAVVQVRGRAVHVDLRTPSRTGSQPPTIVFESGLGETGTRTWSRVLPLLPPDVRVFRYDRPGLGQSADDGEPPTPQHIAALLHDTLAAAGASPPYVLVGHSLGGTRIRMFAGLYPNEVAALVFVEPTPDFTRTAEDDFHDVFEALGLGRKEQEEMRPKAPPADMAPAIARELEMARAMQAAGFPELRALPPIGNMPVIVLAGASLAQWPTSAPGVSFDIRVWARRWLDVRNASLRRFATSLPHGTFLETTRSSHQLQDSEPDLVAWAIERALPKHIRRDRAATFSRPPASAPQTVRP